MATEVIRPRKQIEFDTKIQNDPEVSPGRRVSTIDGPSASRRKSSIEPPNANRRKSSIDAPSLLSNSSSLHELIANRHRMSVVNPAGPSGPMGRRPSQWNFRRPSIAGSHGRFTERSCDGTVRRQRYENTYRMCPDPEEKFNVVHVEQVLSDILQSFLDGETYDAKRCPRMALQLSEIIKERLKLEVSKRFRIICHVMITENVSQSFHCVSRCIWEAGVDNYASAPFKSASIIATATAFGIYLE